MENEKLKVTVVKGTSLAPKNSNLKSSPFCVVTVLDNEGKRVCKEKKTTVKKDSLNPSWNESLEFDVSSNFAGLRVTVWDKHKYMADKFMGECIIKFNVALLSEDKIDDTFQLQKRQNKNDTVSGNLSLIIQYGNKVKKDKSVIKSSKSRSPKPRKEKGEKEKGEKEKGEKGKETVSPRTKSRREKKTPQKISDSSSESNESEKEITPVASSAAWSKQDTKLKKSAYVVIKQELDPTEKYPMAREGPHVAQMTKFENSKITIKGSDLSSNTYGTEVAIANIKIRGNKWYFETKITSSNALIHIGWISNLYKKWADPCGWFMNSQGKKVTQKNVDDSGEPWANGDIIGCALDLVEGHIYFSKNGKKFTSIHNGIIRCQDKGENFIPAIALDNRASVRVNFGETPLAHLPEGFYPIYLKLGTEERNELEEVFNSFVPKKEQNSDSDDEDAEEELIITGSETISLAEKLGIDVTTDIGLLLIAWKLNATQLWSFKQEEFVLGWSVHGCKSLDEMKEKIKEWKKEIKDEERFAKFYHFCFTYLREEKRVITVQEAIMSWDLLLKDIKWSLYDKWKTFISENAKVINIDTWDMLLAFMKEHQKDVKEYDVNSCWPVVFDEFTEWVEDKKKDDE